MLKDTKEGITHHKYDDCWKCSKCGSHYLTESEKIDCETEDLEFFALQQ